jgi:hypothetical protein
VYVCMKSRGQLAIILMMILSEKDRHNLMTERTCFGLSPSPGCAGIPASKASECVKFGPRAQQIRRHSPQVMAEAWAPSFDANDSASKGTKYRSKISLV